MDYKPNIERLTVNRGRGQVPTIQDVDVTNPILSVAEAVVEDCVSIVSNQTRMARESPSVSKVNEHLDAAKKAMSIISTIRDKMPEVDDAFLHRFMAMMCKHTEKIARSDLYREYLFYCDACGFQPLSKFNFFSAVEKKFGVTFSRRGSGEIVGVVAILPQFTD